MGVVSTTMEVNLTNKVSTLIVEARTFIVVVTIMLKLLSPLDVVSTTCLLLVVVDPLVVDEFNANYVAKLESGNLVLLQVRS